MDDFSGRLALVTGAGDGIGEMLAVQLAARGMRVCVQDIREAAAQRVADEIGVQAFALAFDVSDREACLEAAAGLKERGEVLNLLWINAGVGIGSSLLSGGKSAVEWAFGVNVLGAIWTAQCFKSLMDEAEGPRHVGVTASSAALREPGGDFPLYATTKHGTLAVAEALRGELSSEDIGVTILCPGLLSTQIWDGARARPERYGGEARMDPRIATMWNEAKSPIVMWPEIERVIGQGGGYLVCSTDEGGTMTAHRERSDAIQRAIVEI